MHLANPVVLATPFFIALVVAEMVYGRLSGRARYEPRDTAASLLMGFGNVIIAGLFAFIFLDLARLLHPYRLADLGFSLPVFAVCFVLDDLIYYWWHRASHRMRWLWANHVNHHSSQHYNLSTALRQSWGEQFTPGVLFLMPLVAIGFPVPMILFVHGLNLVYQFWIHTEAIDKLPRAFEAVMNTPSHHRVHHATNPAYLDSNYAGVFIVWDRLFGSFVAEREDEPPRYGIVHNLATFNVLKIAFHEWLGLLADLRRAKSLREIVCYVFAPPGWSADGSRETTDSLKAQWDASRAPAE
ncbi:MAG: sterol desaturase family protein [Alphaproteobacteria bacterium]|nr:sterol desaturase family protein [Alphaproteobacteria bacterium]